MSESIGQIYIKLKDPNTDTNVMKIVVIGMLFLLGVSAQAQLDPIFSVDPTYQSGLDSSRYHHRSSSSSQSSTVSQPSSSTSSASDISVDEVPLQPEPAIRPTAPQVLAAGPNISPTTPVAQPKSAVIQPAAPKQREAAPKTASSSVNSVLRRSGLLEIQVAPVYFYDNSQSQYWYRNYNSNGPALDLAATAWLSPKFGLRFEYMSSFESSIPDDPFNGTSRAEVVHQWTNLGVRFRHRFGACDNGPTFTVGVDFSDYKLQVPNWDTGRVGIETSGPRLTLNAEIPNTNHYSWTFGLHLMPRPSHREISTGVIVNSGPENNADEVGASFGGRYRLARQSRIFWQISESVERDDFNGSSSPVDPNSGQPVAGVSVTNAFTFLKLGYIWGN